MYVHVLTVLPDTIFRNSTVQFGTMSIAKYYVTDISYFSYYLSVKALCTLRLRQGEIRLMAFPFAPVVTFGMPGSSLQPNHLLIYALSNTLVSPVLELNLPGLLVWHRVQHNDG